jgi:hypothetical protein
MNNTGLLVISLQFAAAQSHPAKNLLFAKFNLEFIAFCRDRKSLNMAPQTMSAVMLSTDWWRTTWSKQGTLL